MFYMEIGNKGIFSTGKENKLVNFTHWTFYDPESTRMIHVSIVTIQFNRN